MDWIRFTFPSSEFYTFRRHHLRNASVSRFFHGDTRTLVTSSKSLSSTFPVAYVEGVQDVQNTFSLYR